MGTNNNMIINLRLFYHEILSAGLLIKVKIFLGVDGSSLLNYIWNMADTVGIKASFHCQKDYFQGTSWKGT